MEERNDVLFLPLPPFQERYEKRFLSHLVSDMQIDSFSNATRKCVK